MKNYVQMSAKSILFICPYPFGKAPSQRLKFEQYFDYFRLQGFEVMQSSFQSEAMWNAVYKEGGLPTKIFQTILGYWRRCLILWKLPKYDIVYIHLWVTPFGPPFFEWLYSKIAKKIIYDIDDLVFMENASEANSWIAKLKGKKKPIFLMKTAKAIITTTPYLLDYCRQWNSNVYAIPPSLDENKYFPIDKKENKKLTIGWMGSHTTEAYLEIVKPALEEFAKEMDYQFILMGAKEFDIESVETIRYEWMADKENEVLNRIDIALYPLRDEVWSQGKFGGKLIQYFAAGLPTIVSDVNDSNRQVVTQNENGILVKNSSQDWLNALRLLAKDAQLRKNIGQKARVEFLKKYSIEANKAIYLKIINSVTIN
ncbi:MAG: glycosyltransferase family 4 protein [Chitinophagales bacterium]|jgi:glycosyltransferase involved in cell wall biosynthesis|nr:glycosyltransferase family 4 protein [Sphingobacteriales bacterium]